MVIQTSWMPRSVLSRQAKGKVLHLHASNFKAYASATDPLEQQGVGNVDAPLNLSNWFQMIGLPLLIGMFGNAGPLPEGYLRQMFQYYVIVLLFSVQYC